MQFFSASGLVVASQSFSSSEHRMSLVTTLLSPHLAEHWKDTEGRHGVSSISNQGHSHPAGQCICFKMQFRLALKKEKA